MVKHFQNFQNSKFLMSLQYLKEEVRYEVEFIEFIINRHDQAFSKYSKNKLVISQKRS